MRSDLSDRILKRCPTICRGAKDERHKNIMSYGFECGSGWFEMLLLLSESIEKIASTMKAEGVDEDKLPLVCQVKEKLSGLRYYIEHRNYDIKAMIEEAKQKSYGICDVCGGDGQLRIFEGIYMARCHEHLKTRAS